MAKNLKKVLSLLLALSMCMSLLSVTALASEDEEGNTTPSAETKTEFSAPDGEDGSGSGSVEDPKLNITVRDSEPTTDGNGNTTTTTTTEKTWQGKDPQDTDDKETPANPDAPAETVPGAVTEVTGKETTVEGTITDSSGETLKDFGSVTGSETQTTTETTTGETKTEDKGTSTDTSTVPGSSSTSISEKTENDGEAEKTGPSTSEAENTPSIDYSGITVDVTPGKTNSKDIAGTLTEAEKAEALGKLGATETGTTTETVTDSDGNETAKVTTTITATENGDGSITYTKTVTTTQLTPESTSSSSSSSSITDSETGTGDRVQTGETEVTKKATVTPPAKPEEKADVTNDEDGTVTKTTVVEIREVVENGGDDEQLVGYKVITTTVDQNGKTLSTQTKSIYGTVTTESTETKHFQQDTVTKEEVTTVTTKVYKQTVETSTSTVGISSGTLSVSMGGVTVNESKTDISSLQPKSDLRPADGQINTEKDLYGRKPDTPTSDKVQSYDKDYQYRFNGDYALDSSILIKAKGLDGWWAHQFELSKADSNDIFYAYCADFSTEAKEGSVYNMINVEDATYFKDEYDADGHLIISGKKKAEKVRTIALNGYWGTAAGEKDANGNYATGSLEQLKEQLKNTDGWSQDEINAITDGIALTATQAAIWKYGNSGASGVKDNDVFGGTVDNCATSSAGAANLVNKLYSYLTSLTATPAKENTALLGADTIKGSTVSMNSKTGDDSYNTDISFTLAVTPSSKSADSLSLSLTYTDSNGQTRTVTKKLNASDDEFSGSTDGTYTFKGLNIKNGGDVQLTLNGVHTLDQGVYLYSAPTYSGSQTFVGVGEGHQTVDIATTLTINVTDPKASITEESSKQGQNVTETSTEKHTEITTSTKKSDDITTTTTTVDETEWEWHSEWEKNYPHYSSPDGDDDDDDDLPDTPKGDDDDDDDLPDTPKGDDDDDDLPDTPKGDDDDDGDDDNIPEGGTPSTGIPSGGDPSLDIPDGVPTTNVPKTGDASVIWYVLSACSGLGLAGTALLGKKRRDEDDV